MPTDFRAARTAKMLLVNEEAGPLKPIKLQVGSKMVLGMYSRTYLFAEGKAREKSSTESLSPPLDKPLAGARFYMPGLYPGYFAAPDGPLQHGKRCVIEVDYEIFETDIPSQHAWSPHSGKYKVLWKTTLRKVVEEEDRLPADLQEMIDRAPKPQPVPTGTSRPLSK